MTDTVKPGYWWAQRRIFKDRLETPEPVCVFEGGAVSSFNRTFLLETGNFEFISPIEMPEVE